MGYFVMTFGQVYSPVRSNVSTKPGCCALLDLHVVQLASEFYQRKRAGVLVVTHLSFTSGKKKCGVLCAKHEGWGGREGACSR